MDSVIGRREHLLSRLLRLLVEPVEAWRGISDCKGFEREIGELERYLKPTAVVLKCLSAKAATFVEEECGRLSDRADSLYGIPAWTDLRAEEGMVRLPLHELQAGDLPLRLAVRP